jgi:hypothetical protein
MIDYLSLLANISKELAYIFPDAILFGSFLTSIVTVSPQHGVFFLSILESLAFLFGFQKIYSSLVGGTLPRNDCRSSLYKLSFESLVVNPSARQPSYPVYLVSFACTYLAMSLYSIKDELEVLDDIYYKCYITSFYWLFILSLIYACGFMLISCDNISSVLWALILGSVVGVFIVYQNFTLLGKQTVNFLGIPVLRNKTVNNRDLYFCAKNQ